MAHSGNIILKISFRAYFSKESIKNPFMITIFFKIDLLPSSIPKTAAIAPPIREE
jgi:hypothetical protein